MAYKPKSEKERVLHRYKISLGQLRKVTAMVEGGEYCIDILSQSQAVQKALRETDNLLLANHLKTCAARSIQAGKQNKAIAEIMEIFARRS
ncbi:MAG: metal-sensing transcriptional repressor [Candidatus Liptonbacteria bacterium]|nr:metal-sensing transcriptional repressor [Candidatus Liptonbacteria bacterium]